MSNENENYTIETIVFASDDKNNIYKLAYFHELGLRGDYYFYSQVKDKSGRYCICDYKYNTSEGNYFEPITYIELDAYFKDPNSQSAQRTVEMLKLADFTLAITAFHYVEIIVDVGHGEYSINYDVYKKGHEGCESEFPKQNASIDFCVDNSEFYAYTVANKKIWPNYPIGVTRNFIDGWRKPSYQPNGLRWNNEMLFTALENTFLTTKDCQETAFNEDKAEVIGWTYADNTCTKLTKDGIVFAKIIFNEPSASGTDEQKKIKKEI